MPKQVRESLVDRGELSERGEELIERLERLIEEGKQVEGTSSTVNIHKQPIYFEEERFKKAQATCQKYYSNISFASTSGLILLLQIECILVPLLKTNKSRTVPDLYDRYVATAKYMRKIYETNFFDPTTEGWTYVNLVRTMHQKVHRFMKETSVEKTSPNLWVNQYDMALTQFAFVGLFLLRPDKCAAYYVSREELTDVTYYWRLISYYFGIEERFNLFAYSEDFDKQLEFMNLVLEHMKQLLRPPRNQIGLGMAEGFMLAFEDLATESSFNILDHWWSPYVSLSGLEEPKPYTWLDRWKLIFFLLYFKVLFRCKWLLGWINNTYKKKFDKFSISGEKIKPKLAKKYSDRIYEL